MGIPIVVGLLYLSVFLVGVVAVLVVVAVLWWWDCGGGGGGGYGVLLEVVVA